MKYNLTLYCQINMRTFIHEINVSMKITLMSVKKVLPYTRNKCQHYTRNKCQHENKYMKTARKFPERIVPVEISLVKLIATQSIYELKKS